jgi:hypothetical protein
MTKLALLTQLLTQLLTNLRNLRLLHVGGCDRIDPVQRIHAYLLADLRPLLDECRRNWIDTERRRTAELLLLCQLLGKLNLLD